MRTRSCFLIHRTSNEEVLNTVPRMIKRGAFTERAIRDRTIHSERDLRYVAEHPPLKGISLQPICLIRLVYYVRSAPVIVRPCTITLSVRGRLQRHYW